MHDIAVIGAGPAGSTLALALAQRGWDVVLIERDALPRHKVCGEFLSPEAQGTLRQLGLSAQLGTLSPTPLTHATLTRLSPEELRRELVDSKAEIEDQDIHFDSTLPNQPKVNLETRNITTNEAQELNETKNTPLLKK